MSRSLSRCTTQIHGGLARVGEAGAARFPCGFLRWGKARLGRRLGLSTDASSAEQVWPSFTESRADQPAAFSRTLRRLATQGCHVERQARRRVEQVPDPVTQELDDAIVGRPNLGGPCGGPAAL